jgi:hypothetical protein
VNKKAFISTTLITAVVVGGLVYYRHRIREQVASLLDDEDLDDDVFLGDDALGDIDPVRVASPEEYRRLREHLEEP